ncbi:MAG: hypothetical protein P0S95_02710 [Rhabdochlamydiaceae bacterium]|nr:hypothetical protein [Candidatus Amphrikana amoebophyrae]
MDMTFFAKVFGPTLVFFGLMSLFCRDQVGKLSKQLEGETGAQWIEAFLSMLFGMIIVNGVKDWGTGHEVLIPIYGWICFVRGFLLLYFRKPFLSVFNNAPNRIMFGILRLYFGLAFVGVGYFM